MLGGPATRDTHGQPVAGPSEPQPAATVRSASFAAGRLRAAERRAPAGSGTAAGCPGEDIAAVPDHRQDGDGSMATAMAMSGNTAAAFLVHFFGGGLEDERYVVERFKAMADGEIRRMPGDGAAKKGRKARCVTATLKAVKETRAAAFETASASVSSTAARATLIQPQRPLGQRPCRTSRRWPRDRVGWRSRGPGWWRRRSRRRRRCGRRASTSHMRRLHGPFGGAWMVVSRQRATPGPAGWCRWWSKLLPAEKPTDPAALETFAGLL